MMEFSEKLKELRKEADMSQEELADKLYVSRSAIARWENGLGVPSEVNLEQLCKYFDVSMSDFGFTEKIEEPKKRNYSRNLFYVSIALILLSVAILSATVITLIVRARKEDKLEEEKLALVNSLSSNGVYINDKAMNLVEYTYTKGSNDMVYDIQYDTIPDSTDYLICNQIRKNNSYTLNFSKEPDSYRVYYSWLDEYYNPLHRTDYERYDSYTLSALSTKVEWYGPGILTYETVTVDGNTITFDYSSPMAGIFIIATYGDLSETYCILVTGKTDSELMEDVYFNRYGTYTLSDSSNTENPLEEVNLVLKDDSTAILSYKEEGHDAYSVTTSYTAEIEEPDSLYSDINIVLNKEDAFPFLTSYYLILQRDDDGFRAEFTGTRKDGGGNQTVTLVKTE